MLMLNHLNGFGVGGSDPLTTLTQVLSATDSNGAAFTLPVGIIAGDLIVVWDSCSTVGVPTTVLPADFNQIANVSLTDSKCILSYKIAVGTESGASVNGMDGSGGEAKMTYVFRGNVPITSATPTDVNSQMTDGNPTAQVVNASGAPVPLVVIGAYAVQGGGDVNPRTFSPAKDGEINVTDFIVGASDAWLAYKIYNSAPADTTIDMDDEVQRNALASCYIACA